MPDVTSVSYLRARQKQTPPDLRSWTQIAARLNHRRAIDRGVRADLTFRSDQHRAEEIYAAVHDATLVDERVTLPPPLPRLGGVHPPVALQAVRQRHVTQSGHHMQSLQLVLPP